MVLAIPAQPNLSMNIIIVARTPTLYILFLELHKCVGGTHRYYITEALHKRLNQPPLEHRGYKDHPQLPQCLWSLVRLVEMCRNGFFNDQISLASWLDG